MRAVHDWAFYIENLLYSPSSARILQVDSAGSSTLINDVVDHDQQRVDEADPHSMSTHPISNGDSTVYVSPNSALSCSRLKRGSLLLAASIADVTAPYMCPHVKLLQQRYILPRKNNLVAFGPTSSNKHTAFRSSILVWRQA